MTSHSTIHLVGSDPRGPNPWCFLVDHFGHRPADGVCCAGRPRGQGREETFQLEFYVKRQEATTAFPGSDATFLGDDATHPYSVTWDTRTGANGPYLAGCCALTVRRRVCSLSLVHVANERLAIGESAALYSLRHGRGEVERPVLPVYLLQRSG
jgi:hypothetical protein